MIPCDANEGWLDKDEEERETQAPEGEKTRHELWLRPRGGSADDVEK